MRPSNNQSTITHPIFSFANGEMGIVSNHFIRSIEKITGQPRIRKLYVEYVNDDMPPKNFWSDALSRLDIKINLTRQKSCGIAASIPANGKVLAIANHPYGVIDGLVLCALMAEVREDYKIITHRVLRQAPAVMEKILPIDFDETEEALYNNLKTRADACEHLKNDGAVIIFPAGAISLAPKLIGDAVDGEWKTFVAKLAQVPGTTTIPFYFDGCNSLLYQMARRISVTLGYSLMFREICKKMGHTISIKMRQPIDASVLSQFSNRAEMTHYLRKCTYGS